MIGEAANTETTAPVVSEPSTLEAVREMYREAGKTELISPDGEGFEEPAEESEASGDTTADPDEAEASGDASEDDDSEESDDTETDDHEGTSAAPTVGKKATELWEKGEFAEAVAEAFGKDALDKLKVDKAQYFALREKRRKTLDTIEREKNEGLSQVTQARSALQEMAKKAHEAIAPGKAIVEALINLRQNGDPDGFVQEFEKHSGYAWAEFLQDYAQNRQRPASERATAKRTEELQRKVSELEAKLAGGQPQPQQTEEQAKAQFKAEMATFNEKLDEHFDGHKVTRLPKWRKLIYEELRAHADPKTKTSSISWDTAAKRVVKRAERLAEGLGYAPPTGGKGTAAKNGSAASGKTLRRGEADGTQSAPNEADSDAFDIAAARREYRRQQALANNKGKVK